MPGILVSHFSSVHTYPSAFTLVPAGTSRLSGSKPIPMKTPSAASSLVFSVWVFCKSTALTCPACDLMEVTIVSQRISIFLSALRRCCKIPWPAGHPDDEPDKPCGLILKDTGLLQPPYHLPRPPPRLYF